MIFLKGLLMGAADIVPGVSGGTIAFITGIYDRLIFSLKDAGKFAKLSLQKISGSKGVGWKKIWDLLDIALFLPLGVGIVVAFGAGSLVIPGLIEAFPGYVYSFFIGLILASAWIVWRHIKAHTPATVFLLLCGVLIGVAISLIPVADASEGAHPLSIFGLGMLAICAMILPGISGSYMLLMFGRYEYMLHAIRTLDSAVISIFILGAILGLLLFANVLSWLLKRYHAATFSALLGLMIGALTRPVGDVAASNASFLGAAAMALVGIILVVLVERVARS